MPERMRSREAEVVDLGQIRSAVAEMHEAVDVSAPPDEPFVIEHSERSQAQPRDPKPERTSSKEREDDIDPYRRPGSSRYGSYVAMLAGVLAIGAASVSSHDAMAEGHAKGELSAADRTESTKRYYEIADNNFKPLPDAFASALGGRSYLEDKGPDSGGIVFGSEKYRKGSFEKAFNGKPMQIYVRKHVDLGYGSNGVTNDHLNEAIDLVPSRQPAQTEEQLVGTFTVDARLPDGFTGEADVTKAGNIGPVVRGIIGSAKAQPHMFRELSRKSGQVFHAKTKQPTMAAEQWDAISVPLVIRKGNVNQDPKGKPTMEIKIYRFVKSEKRDINKSI